MLREREIAVLFKRNNMVSLQYTFSYKEIMMKIEEIGILEAFQGVAVHGGFSKASRALKIGVPQISKRIAKLEAVLGIRLFQRSTRIVTLTEEGRALLPRVTAILDDLAGIESSFGEAKEISGVIRLTSVPFIAHRLLIPLIAQFRKKYPKINIELEVSEGILNLIESNIDLAIRIHDDPEDSNLIYRKLGSNQLVLCASPQYLNQNKNPLRSPLDLHHHELLMLEVHDDVSFKNSAHSLKDFKLSKKTMTENGWILTQMAIAGLGVLVRSSLDVEEHIRKGELVPVLKKYPLDDFGSIYAVIPSRRFLAPRVRVFLDHLMKESL